MVALPMLEIMLDRPRSSFAAEPPKRYLVCFGGQSLGSDDDPLHNDYVPDTIGPGYDLKSALAPFADFGVENEITVVSGLNIPTANGGAVPPGGRHDDFHINSLSPLFSGVRSGDMHVNGPTSDQIVADAIGNDTIFKSLVYRIQAAWYLSVSAPYGRDVMSYKLDGGGDLTPIPATVSPKQAFDALFNNFVPPDDPAEAAEVDFRWRARKSVIDLVRGNAERLVERLGGADRQRIERHLDEIRDLEKRVSTLPPTAQGACQPPADPGDDSPVGGNQAENGYDTNAGYSNEEERARIFCDLVHMAFTCDLTRVGTLMFTMAQSHMNMYQLTGQATDLHEIGHHGVPGGTMAVSTAIAWHMKHFAYLIAKLRDTPEGTGTLLDNCAVVFLHEGGHGLDTATGKEFSSHSTENMACLIAGRAGGLKAGHHVVAQGRHPANVLVTAMNAVGVSATSLGEVNGAIPDLFGA
jgi:hypothetical protein